MSLITIIVPCVNEEESIAHLHAELSRVASMMAPVEFEFLFVDDGSTDGTASAIDRLRSLDGRIRRLSFSRNFGKEAAMFAGLKHARGEFVAIIDADLQDPPELLIPMYDALTREGFDCAAAQRTSRDGESRLKSVFSEQFYRVFNLMSKTHLVNGARDFRLMTNRMVYSILDMSEYNRFSKGIFSWVGFRTKWIPYEHTDRVAGTTKWSFWRLWRYAMEGIINFSTVPLALSSAMGTLFALIGIAWGAALGISSGFGRTTVAGWSVVAAIVLFVSGIQLLGMGILGGYMARTYLETKHRPLYVIRESVG